MAKVSEQILSPLLTLCLTLWIISTCLLFSWFTITSPWRTSISMKVLLTNSSLYAIPYKVYWFSCISCSICWICNLNLINSCSNFCISIRNLSDSVEDLKFYALYFSTSILSSWIVLSNSEFPRAPLFNWSLADLLNDNKFTFQFCISQSQLLGLKLFVRTELFFHLTFY